MSKTRQKLEADSWFAVVRAYQACTRRYQEMLQEFGLTVAQYDVMSAIARLGDQATPKAIADELLVTRGNITGLLNRLEEHQLIETRANEQDGRSFICQLSRAGKAAYARARSAASVFVQRQLAPFDDRTLAATETQMDTMRAHLETLDVAAIVNETDNH